MKQLRVPISNLSCACCVFKIEQVMRQQVGVIWATVNYAAREVVIIYDPSAFRITPLVQAVNRLGYQVVFESKTVREPMINFRNAGLFAWLQNCFSRSPAKLNFPE